MKRVFSIVMVLALALCIFAGCSSSEDTAAADVKLSDVLSSVNEKYPDAVKGLTELKAASDLNRYYEIDEDAIEDFAAEINTDSSKAALEIVIVKTDKPEDVKQKLDIRYQAILSQYASYSADQLKMAKDGGVETAGDYVYLVVAEDSKGIMEKIKDKLG